MAKPPLVIAGGSLTARNERILLDRYPNLIIGRGAGEPTIADGDLDPHLLIQALHPPGEIFCVSAAASMARSMP